MVEEPVRTVTDFPPEIDAALGRLAASTRGLIEVICGVRPRANAVSSAFGLHAKLGWQIWKVAYGPPLLSARFLPNPGGLTSWLKAARSRGAPPLLLADFEVAVDELNRLMGVHAEDREMFELLLDAHEPNGHEAEVRWRKEAFLGNSFTFGARAKCLLATAILFPGASQDSISLVRLNGLFGLTRSRAGLRWPFSTMIVQHGDITVQPRREPLQPSDSSAPLVHRFCSSPLPPVERRMHGSMQLDELLPGPVGGTGTVSLVTGEIVHEIGSRFAAYAGEYAYFGSGIRTPSELLVSDHIVHRSLFPNACRELKVYSELISSTTRDDRDLLTLTDPMIELGPGLPSVKINEFPTYRDLLTIAFDRIGMNPDEFDVFRVQLRYPPMPASVMVRHLLEPPG